MLLARVFLNAMGKRVRNEFFVRLNQLEFGFDHAFDYGFDYGFDYAFDFAFDYAFEHCFKPSRF
jgi:hypothetical protein